MAGSTFIATLKFVDSFSGGFKSAITQLTNGSKTAQRQCKALQQEGAKLQALGAKMLVPAISLGTVAVKSAMSYETSLAKVSTMQNKMTESMTQAEETIKNYSGEFGKDINEVAESYYTLTSAVADTSKINVSETLGVAMKMAVAGATTTTGAVDALSSAMNAYYKQGVSASQVADIMARTVEQGKTSIEALGESMSTVLPTASSLGVDISDVYTSMAVLTSTGVSTAEAVTMLNNAFTQITKKGEKDKIANGGMLDYLKSLQTELGLSKEKMEEFKANQANMSDEELNEWLKQAGVNTEKLMDKFSNIRAFRGMVGLTNNIDLFEKMGNEIKNSNGAIDSMYQKFSDTTAYSFNQTLQNLKNNFMEIGIKLLPTVNETLKSLNTYLSKLDEGTIENVFKLGRALLVVGGTLMTIGTALRTIGTVAEKWNALKGIDKALGGTTTPAFNPTTATFEGGKLAGAGTVSAGTALAGAGVGLGASVATIAGLKVLDDVAWTKNYEGMKEQTVTQLKKEQDPKLIRNYANQLKEHATSEDLEKVGIEKDKEYGAGTTNISIPKLADSIVIEKEADADSFIDKFANMLKGVLNNR